MGHLEHRVKESFTGPVPEPYRRYIDVGFRASSLSESVLLDFVHFVQDFLDQMHPQYIPCLSRIRGHPSQHQTWQVHYINFLQTY